jgi:hypothetical protein
LGEEGEGFKIAMTVLDAGRIGIASQAIGVAEAAFEAAVKYANEREAFGQKIGQFQGLQWMIADMKTRIEAARMLTYGAALKKMEAKHNPNIRYTLEASMALSPARPPWVTEKLCRFMAAWPAKELPIELLSRSKITVIYEGMSEIQRRHCPNVWGHRLSNNLNSTSSDENQAKSSLPADTQSGRAIADYLFIFTWRSWSWQSCLIEGRMITSGARAWRCC